MSKTNPLISVVIPHYRRLNFTIEAIKSVLNQKKINQKQIEIIVSDEENHQKTKSILISLANNLLYTSNIFPKGPGGNRQSGIKKARGEFIICLDSDDQLHPEFISSMLQVMRKNTQYAAAVCLSLPKFEPGFCFIEKIKLLPLMIIRDISLIYAYLFNHGYLYPSSFYLCQLSHMIFKNENAKNIDFNHEYLHGGEDWDFIIKNLLHGPIVIVPKKLLLFRYSPDSSTNLLINRQLKWQSYSLLASRLPSEFQKGLYHYLFLKYINLFRKI
jgi:glycosyltransferase involved in cell wall biosynthesis